MFGFFDTIIVDNKNGTYTIKNFKSFQFLKALETHYGTSKFALHSFLQPIKPNSLTMYSWYIPDLVYICDDMLNNGKRSKGNIITAPFFKKAVAIFLSQLKTNTWYKSVDDEFIKEQNRLDLSKLKELAYPPLGHQLDWLNYYNKNITRYNLKGSLMHAAAGTGKTYMGLATAHCLNADRVIVVCPKNALNKVWVSNVESVFSKAQTFWVSDRDLEYKDERFILVHYESLSKVLHFTSGFKGKKTVVILDESHNFNNMDSFRTPAFLELCSSSGASDIMLASGTPIKALGKETIPLFKAVDPFFIEPVESSFKKLYGKDPTRGAEVLKARLGLVSFIIKKEAINVSKPSIIDVKVKIPDGQRFTLASIAEEMKAFVSERKEYYKSIMDETKKFYDTSLIEHEKTLRTSQQEDAFFKYKKSISIVIANYKAMSLSECPEELRYCSHYELKHIIPSLQKDAGRRFKDIRSVIKYVGLKIQGECLGRVLSRRRIDCHVSMCSGIDFETYIDSTEKKTVVFTSFTEVLVAAEKRITQLGYKPITVYGANNKDRDASITKFAALEEINPIIATFASLSTAVPLIMADTMIMIDTPFRAYIQEQAISRIYRLGQTSETTVYRVSLDTGEEKNISTRSVDILKWSQDQVELITGVKSPFDLTEHNGNLATERYDLVAEAINDTQLFLSENIGNRHLYASW